MFRETCSPNTSDIVKSLAELYGDSIHHSGSKAYMNSQLSPRDSSSVTECSGDKLEVISVSGSPPLHRSFVGFCCCRGEAAVAVWESCTGDSHRSHQGSRSAQQLWGGGARGHCQPLFPLPDPPVCTHRKAQSQSGLHSCANNHISH